VGKTASWGQRRPILTLAYPATSRLRTVPARYHLSSKPQAASSREGDANPVAAPPTRALPPTSPCRRRPNLQRRAKDLIGEFVDLTGRPEPVAINASGVESRSVFAFVYLETPPSLGFPQIKQQKLTKGRELATLYSVMNESQCAQAVSATSCNADLHFSPPRGWACVRQCCVPKIQMPFK